MSNNKISSKERYLPILAEKIIRQNLSKQDAIDRFLETYGQNRFILTALGSILNGPEYKLPKEPWLTAWKLIKEYPQKIETSDFDLSDYNLENHRQKDGLDRNLIENIVKRVEPRIKISSPRNSFEYRIRNNLEEEIHKKSFDLKDIISINFTSGELISLSVFKIDEILDVNSLIELADALKLKIDRCLNLTHRIGLNKKRNNWRLGEIKRVYYVKHRNAYPNTTRIEPMLRDDDPDEFSRGFAPSVKLLFEVVARLASLEKDKRALNTARYIVARWSIEDASIYKRLWAAMAARFPRLVSIDQISDFLFQIDASNFWTMPYCEIAEMRALRFKDLDQKVQIRLVTKIVRGPPRSIWGKSVDEVKVRKYSRHVSMSELRRIQIGGGSLPTKVNALLKSYEEEQRLNPDQFNGLELPKREDGFIEFDFPEGTKASFVPPNPDAKFDDLKGDQRLGELEKDLSSNNRSWDNDPVDRARDWLMISGNTIHVLCDFETAANGGDNFPNVWLHFGWSHRPADLNQSGLKDPEIAERVLILLGKLSDGTIERAIEGISSWLDAWSHSFEPSLRLLLPVWKKAWPIAVTKTNAKVENTGETNLNDVVSADNDKEPNNLYTLNTAAGKLVSVFLKICPKLYDDKPVFMGGSVERQMRDLVIAAEGRSGLIAKYRLIEALSYFLRANSDWSRKHLIKPLRKDDHSALILWRALGRRTQFTNVLKELGDEICRKTTDSRLGETTRRQFVFSLVIESLHALREENRNPAVRNEDVQQVIRTVEAKLRVSAANAVQRFVAEFSKKENDPTSVEDLFNNAAKKFINDIWPKERSLITPSVSAEFAQLPAVCGKAFADAVATVERYLMPFESWSLMDYGLYKYDNIESGLAKIINDGRKADALLTLLDLTIGKGEDARIPYGVTEALAQVEKCDPSLTTDFRFRRLAAAARR